MWKLQTLIFAEEIYCHLIQNSFLPNKWKSSRKESRGTKDQLLVDKVILRNCRIICKGLLVGWIDYKRSFDMVPCSWLKEGVEIVGWGGNVKRQLFNSMEKLKMSPSKQWSFRGKKYWYRYFLSGCYFLLYLL